MQPLVMAQLLRVQLLRAQLLMAPLPVDLALMNIRLKERLLAMPLRQRLGSI